MQSLDQSALVAVIGAGAMGAGIAQVAAAAGHPVKLYDLSADATKKAIEGLGFGLEKQVKRGKLSAEERIQILGRIKPVAELSELADAALVIEAVVENLAVKQQIFAELESLCSSEVILASNTSSISITSLACGLKQPERLAGMHFFNPPQAMKLVEVITGLATDDAVIETLMATAKTWGKQAVRAKSTPGFIVNRVARPFYAEALRMLQDGIASCIDIDETISASGGFRMGPFTLMDLIGHDVNYAVTESVFAAYYQDSRFKPSFIQKELVSGGFLGRKSGQGFYRYDVDMPLPNYLPDYLSSGPEQKHVDLIGEPIDSEAVLSCCDKHGLSETRKTSGTGDYFEVAGVRLAVTDGRTATERSLADGHVNWVLMDLNSNFETASTITLACSDLAEDGAVSTIAGFLQALGKKVLLIDDAPAMVLMRTVCMLVNEGADTVKEGVCDAAAVDLAMRLGTNYPQGPLAWGEVIGLSRVLAVIEHLHRWYGEDRYRSSTLLRRLVLSGASFHA